jgi:RES domain-containing protein
LPDPGVVQRVDSVDPVPLNARLFRLMSGRYSPLSGEGARTVGGRWNPPGSFPTLYLASTEATAVAEVERGFAVQGRSLRDAIGLVIYEYEVDIHSVLDLTSTESMTAVGLATESISSPDRSACQAVGDAAHFVGLEAIRAPSAAGNDETVALFLDKQQPGSVVTPIGPRPWER